MDQPPITITPANQRCEPDTVYFNRDELNLILGIYGRMVSAGHWKDYAINASQDCAIFSAFRRSCENPEFQIVKDPSLAQKQGSYAILSAQGQILKRGKSLENALKVFERKLMKIVND